MNITPPSGVGNGPVQPQSQDTVANAPQASDSVAFLHELGRRAYEHATSLSVEQRIGLLASVVRPWDGITAATIYTDGTKDTRDGYGALGSWQELGEMLVAFSQNVVPKKGDGAWMTPALSTNGRCRDRDIAMVSQISFDCDGAGDWDVVREVLDGAGVAYIVQRSSSHRPEHPKFHLHIPLLHPWSGSKKEWRRVYRHAVGWFSGAAELRADLDANPATYGFDHKTDRLGQPWFLPTRRSEDDQVPQTIVTEGGALELDVPDGNGF